MPLAAFLLVILHGVRPLPTRGDCVANARTTHAARPPRLSRLAPGSISSTALAAGGAVWVDVKGRGFDPTHNAVSFGPVTLRAVTSSDRCTHLRFVVPTQFPASGEVPPQQIGVGTYRVRVTTPRGTSNALSFVITGR